MDNPMDTAGKMMDDMDRMVGVFDPEGGRLGPGATAHGPGARRLASEEGRRHRMTDRTLELKTWRTPLTGPTHWHKDEPIYKGMGFARLRHTHYKPGTYRMEGVMGFKYWHSDARLPLTELQLRDEVPHSPWKTWMVDDPLHWLGMKDFARRARPGAVLVAGLGLGQVVFHLLRRPDITAVTVIERSRAVIDLMLPLLPQDPRLNIICDDYYTRLKSDYPSPALRKPHYGTVIVDLWVGSGEDCQADYEWARLHTEYLFPYPSTLSLYWGFQKLVDLGRHAEDAFEEHLERQGPPYSFSIGQRVKVTMNDLGGQCIGPVTTRYRLPSGGIWYNVDVPVAGSKRMAHLVIQEHRMEACPMPHRYGMDEEVLVGALLGNEPPKRGHIITQGYDADGLPMYEVQTAAGLRIAGVPETALTGKGSRLL